LSHFEPIDLTVWPHTAPAEKLWEPADYKTKSCTECLSRECSADVDPCASCWNIGRRGGDNFEAAPPKSSGNPGMSGQYTFRGGIEPLEFISSNGMNFLEGSVIKYIYRYPEKGGLESLKKARFYLDQLITLNEE
jgi:hypothetical protein